MYGLRHILPKVLGNGPLDFLTPGTTTAGTFFFGSGSSKSGSSISGPKGGRSRSSKPGIGGSFFFFFSGAGLGAAGLALGFGAVFLGAAGLAFGLAFGLAATGFFFLGFGSGSTVA
jgi:hypothetical protein